MVTYNMKYVTVLLRHDIAQRKANRVYGREKAIVVMC